MPISAPHYDARFCARRGCVVSKIAEFRAVLADPGAPRASRRQALRYVVHLVQDLHQPMHVADRDDRGGNDLQLRLGRYEHTNLHQVWDSGLFRLAVSRARRGRAGPRRDGPGRPARGREPGSAAGSRTGPTRASRSAGGRTSCPGTDRTLRAGDEIGPGYVDANLPLAVERVAQSGVRLAAMLNEILGD